MLTVDGSTYDNVIISPIKREAVIREGENSGYTLDGIYHRDVVGTYYNYTLKLNMTRASEDEYTDLYETLTSPEPHTITLPYNQTTLQFNAYIKTVTDVLSKKTSTRNWWTDLTVKFLAATPTKVPVA